MPMSDQRDHHSKGARPTLFGVYSPADDRPSTLRSVADSTGFWSARVRDLAERVGGIDELERLDDDPIPDEAFRWTGIDPRHRPLVDGILGALDDGIGATIPIFNELPGTGAVAAARGLMQRFIDAEHRTIVRRLLSGLAGRDPAVLARASPERTAAGLVWLTLHGNAAFHRGRGSETGQIWKLFGVSSCSDIGRVLGKALGFTEKSDARANPRGAAWLCDPELMHSRVRRDYVGRRRMIMDYVAEEDRRRERERPLRQLADGGLRIAARPVTPRWAMRSENDCEKSTVVVTFGEREDDPQVLALSVPGARHLISMLERALAVPFRRGP
jgi:hypothetical protein